MENKTILFLTPRMGIGGAQRYVIEKAKWLHNHNYKVIVCSEDGIWSKKLKDLGIEHIALEWINENPYILDYEIFIERLMTINAIMENNNVDIIEANQLFPAVYAYNLVKITHKPLLLNTLSELSFLNSRNIELLVKMNSLGLYFNLGKESNAILEQKNGIKLENCVNIPIPVSTHELKLSRGEYILTVARFAEEKRYVEYLMKDYVYFINSNKLENYDLLVVGDGKLYRKFEKLSKRLNRKIKTNCRILLLGNKVDDELSNLYKDCDIYVGMGTTLISAASFSKPAIIATFPPYDISKAFGYFGATSSGTSYGQVTDIMERKSYAHYLERVYFDQDYYEKVSLEGYNLVKNTYDIDIVMRRWVEVYQYFIGMRIDYTTEKVIFEPIRMNVLRIIFEIKYILKKLESLIKE